MDLLNIFGIVVSSIGVILSVMLFNASINNGRKILINKILNKIEYELLYMFINNENNRIEKIKDFMLSMIKINALLDEISCNIKHPIPGIQQSSSYLEDGMVRERFMIKNTYEDVKEYFNVRNIKCFDFLFECYDNRLYLLDNYNRKIKYIKSFFFGFGTIKGVKLEFIRQRKYVSYSRDNKVKLISSIKDMKDLRKYYDKCFTKFGIKEFEKVKFDRLINDIEVVVPKDKQHSGGIFTIRY